MGIGLILQKINQPKVLHNRVHPQQEQTQPVKRHSSLLILDRIKIRAWLDKTETELFYHIQQLHWQAKMIEYLPKNKRGLLELTLDVERYCGSKCGIWWIDLRYNSETELTWRSIPKAKDYHIGSYWEQSAWFEVHGNCDVPGQNTDKFILDRSKWAYKKIGENIRICRRLLRLVRNWNFSEEQQHEICHLEDKLFKFGIVLP